MKRLMIVLALTGASCGKSQECIKPENPYPEHTHYYAGWEWAEVLGGGCDSRTAAFFEGCRAYKQAALEYEECR